MLLPVFAMAQASGGQIKRNAQKQTTTSVKDVTKSVGYGYTGKENGHEYVDLGLSVKWATCNVGASKPEEYGNYYAWGETEIKTDYSWSNYFDSKDSEGNSFFRYYVVDEHKTLNYPISLSVENDVAHKEWGGEWRIPSADEYEELFDCTWKYINNKGIYGYKIIGKNGNSIFMPATGFSSENQILSQNKRGYYWCSSLWGSKYGSGWLVHDKWSSCCTLAEHEGPSICGMYRFRGCSIRPVF